MEKLFGRRRGEKPCSDEDLLMTALEIAQTQLLAQIADENSLDGRTTGVLAFNGALLAADVAARGLLGGWWWTTLVALGSPILLCLRSILADEADLGPPPSTFYSGYGSMSSVSAKEQLLADFSGAFERNAKRIKRKTQRLRWTLGTLVVGMTVAVLIISTG
jgi:hypothetical protein